MSLSFYRKYRPQVSAELDLKVVRSFFERILQSGQVSHAYLFTGPKGAGKTSAARILAKMVNCEKNSKLTTGYRLQKDKKSSSQNAVVRGHFQEPCNKCEACVSITSGTNMDVMEIDAASNRGIDDIRNLREKVRLSPVTLAHKVYIIDEVHMLTMEAFNALLKTLEEPPSHVLFVLATTELHKVPDTIVSRCVRLHFPQATDAEVARSLQKAIEGEKLTVEEGVTTAIARAADGSFREAMKLLEQLALGGVTVKLKRAAMELGQSDLISPNKLLGFLVIEDQQQAMKELQRLEGQGVNWQMLVREGLEVLREELLQILGVEGEWYRAGKLGQVSVEKLRRLIEVWMRAAREMRDAPITQLPLELMVAEWCEYQNGQTANPPAGGSTTPIMHEAKSKTEEPRITQIKSDELKIENDQRQVTGRGQVNKPVSPQRLNESVRTEESKTDNRKPAADSGHLRTGQSTVRLEEVQQRWREVLAAVRPHNHSLEGLLRSTRPVEMVGGTTLKIEVFYQFHLDQLKQDRFLRIIEQVMGEVFLSNLKLEYVLGSKPRRVAALVENISGDVSDSDVLKAAEEIFGA